MRFAIRCIVISSALFLPAAVVDCGGDDPTAGPTAADGRDAAIDQGDADKPLVPASKVDLLFVVDNSSSMGGKQAILARSVARVLEPLVAPTDGSHAPIRDVHVGVVSTSLATGDVCASDSNLRKADDAHLLAAVPTTDGGPANDDVATSDTTGFLSLGERGIDDLAALEKATADIIANAGQTGCGLEAQLESLYRFLVQPDPPRSSAADGGGAVSTGVDDVVLAQRKAFLRPDSAVAIVLLTDEDDSNLDPRSVNGAGYAYGMLAFPSSKVTRAPGQGTTAPRGTSVCATAPGSTACTSCGLHCDPADPACALTKSDVNCTTSGAPPNHGDGYDGYFAPADDSLNVRFFHTKQRFGLDPQYPIERYVRALSARTIPNRDGEHPGGGAYASTPSCTNPLFAASLPASSAEELCALPDGPRSRQLVFFGLIGGVPNELLTPAPDWTKILGANPDAYDTTGIDPHMIPSITPRPALDTAANPSAAPIGDNGTDPIHGREWTTNGADLQYACTFPLAQPLDCSAPASGPLCDCLPPLSGPPRTNPPLCDVNRATTQVRGKAYPTIRELRVAKELGDRAVVGSICALDPDAGYGPTLDALARRMAESLAK